MCGIKGVGCKSGSAMHQYLCCLRLVLNPNGSECLSVLRMKIPGSIAGGRGSGRTNSSAFGTTSICSANSRIIHERLSGSQQLLCFSHGEMRCINFPETFFQLSYRCTDSPSSWGCFKHLSSLHRRIIFGPNNRKKALTFCGVDALAFTLPNLFVLPLESSVLRKFWYKNEKPGVGRAFSVFCKGLFFA